MDAKRFGEGRMLVLTRELGVDLLLSAPKRLQTALRFRLGRRLRCCGFGLLVFFRRRAGLLLESSLLL